MKIGVTSQNKLKLNAVINAYRLIQKLPQVIGYETPSDVGEQPVNEQALLGARNRIINLRKKVDGLDRIISIENGIFQENNQWVDRAVIVIYNVHLNKELVAYSEGVVFPDKYVEMAKKIGFDKITVGFIMANEGYVLDSKDPHKSISGISRQVYLEECIAKLIKEAETNRNM